MKWLVAPIATLATGGFALSAAPAQPSLVEQFPDVLELRGRPSDPGDHARNLFFDQGAWQGYALRPRGERGLGFIGPYWLAGGGVWLSDSFGEIEISNPGGGGPIDWSLSSTSSSALPGRLVSRAEAGSLAVRETLIFADRSTALIRLEIDSATPRTITVALVSHAFVAGSRYSADAGDALATNERLGVTVRTGMLGGDARVDVSPDGRSARVVALSEVRIIPHTTTTLFFREAITAGGGWAASLGDPEKLIRANEQRWTSYLSRVLGGSADLAARSRYRHAAVKAIETLISNWRAAAGDLPRAGLFPSYSNPDYNGYWAWDSWKHALALSRFAPELAEDQILAMFDLQDDAGMVPDVIYRDKTENNRRDTKPPLAALAVWDVYERTHDVGFLRELYPKLLKYHAWWYSNRDHDGNGLAEYGSTDGTLEAARWESGMDNAARFDTTQLVQNGATAWSMDQESVDLNCFLYVDKRSLARIAATLGDRRETVRLRKQAATLKTLIQRRFFDPQRGFFADYSVREGRLVPHSGPEGWMPLWAGVATRAQARAVAAKMMDSSKFLTYFPLPTLAADDPAFAPRKGYWRGPVWIDQAYFGIRGLENYGLDREAQMLRHRLLDRARGLNEAGPIFENYDPGTGEGLNAPNFSWSAGCFLLLLLSR